MGLKVQSSEYKINFSADVKGEKKGTFTTDDVVAYNVHRVPIVNACPFSTIIVDMEVRFMLGFKERVNSKDFPNATVTVEWADNSTDDGSNFRKGSTKYLTNVNSYKVIKFYNLDQPSDADKMARVKLYLAEPLFFWMNHAKGSNITLRDKTAMEAIEYYEGYIWGEYGGGGTFDPPKHLIQPPSEFVYRRMQLKAASELILPSMIMGQYKPLNNVGYYFLDSFRSLGEAHKRILPLMVDLGSPDKHECYDITQNGHEDVAMGYIVDEKTFGDLSDRFKQYGDYGYTIRDSKRWKRYEPTEPVDVPKYISSDASAFHNEGHSGGRGGPIEKFHPISNSAMTHTKPPKEALEIYAGDNIDLAKPRFEAVKAQVTSTIKGSQVYYFPEAQPNSIELQRKYNLDKYAPGDFNYVCVGIYNQFRKINMKEARYNHSALVKFFVY